MSCSELRHEDAFSVRGRSNVTKVQVRCCYRPNGKVLFRPVQLARSRVRFPAGSQRIVNLFGSGIPRQYYCKVERAVFGPIQYVRNVLLKERMNE